MDYKEALDVLAASTEKFAKPWKVGLVASAVGNLILGVLLALALTLSTGRVQPCPCMEGCPGPAEVVSQE